MGENSKIEWTDHTFNIVWGCQRVSPACENCYAEAFSHRLGKNLWGPKAERQVMSESYWRQPLKWNRQAEKEGKRRRVFCSSMADVFEDHPTVNGERWKLWEMVTITPYLDWLLLTKRPENFRKMLPAAFLKNPYPNVWLGVTAENQEWADKRVPLLLETPAAVRFISAEPLLGPIDLTRIPTGHWAYGHVDVMSGYLCGDEPDDLYDYDADPDGWIRKPAGRWERGKHGLDWVIVGGESGHGARPMNLEWARSLRDQCTAAGVAFHFKQHGEFIPIQYRRGFWIDANGQLVEDWRVEDSVWDETKLAWLKVGKKAAGRILDGRTWDEFPNLKPEASCQQS